MPTGKCGGNTRSGTRIATNTVKIGPSKDNQWMLNLGKEQEILHGFKMSSHGLLIGCKGKIFIILSRNYTIPYISRN